MTHKAGPGCAYHPGPHTTRSHAPYRRKVGRITTADRPSYAPLSAPGDDDSELQEFGIPNVNAFG